MGILVRNLSSSMFDVINDEILFLDVGKQSYF